MNIEPIPFMGWVDISVNSPLVPEFSGLSKSDIDAADALTNPNWDSYNRSDDDNY